jgi:hypothetical protein
MKAIVFTKYGSPDVLELKLDVKTNCSIFDRVKMEQFVSAQVAAQQTAGIIVLGGIVTFEN